MDEKEHRYEPRSSRLAGICAALPLEEVLHREAG